MAFKGEARDGVLTVLKWASQALLLQPQPSLQQLDDWFPFEALPLGFIKSKCKPVQQIAEKMPVASFHLWLGPDYFDKLRRWWGSQISSQWFGWHFEEIEDFSVYVSFFFCFCICANRIWIHTVSHTVKCYVARDKSNNFPPNIKYWDTHQHQYLLILFSVMTEFVKIFKQLIFNQTAQVHHFHTIFW